ncbi:MAG: hypothetical protein A2Y17_10970 [Clostridiales bacterium GWF2_38_85]|nr:MAG: hypothetical protein A2Y17_10970 [Clostridiales bacterium GWF2_38_85]
MEWSRMSDDSIRFLLTKDEITELELTAAYKGKIYRSEIEKLLEIKYRETGFDISNCQALVQLFPKNNGSIEIFITKIDNSEKVEVVPERRFRYFIFEDSDALIDGCMRIKAVESMLYYTDVGEFIVSIPVRKCEPEISDILSEYAYETEDEDIEDELSFVCKNGIAKIQQAFNKKN